MIVTSGAIAIDIDHQPSVVAVVLTFRRVRLATQVVRGLIDHEGFAPEHVIVVVNGEGGVDEALAEQVHLVELNENLGPAGGFRAGLEAAARTGATWAYLCEDDVGLFALPSPRVADLIERVESLPGAESVGAVAAYGRRLDHRTGRTSPVVPTTTEWFREVDAAAWGASLVRCDLAHRGILPDTSLFFGFEDFDFWYAMRRAGFRLLLDVPTAREVASRVFHENRDTALAGARPIDVEEPWRRYYEARNFVHLRRRYGHAGWTRWHLLLTLRRIQLSPTWAHRRAAFHGLIHGLLGRTGRDDRYLREVGERSPDDQRHRLSVLQVITDNDRRGGQVFATDLEDALKSRGLTVRTVALAPAVNPSGLSHDVLGPSRRHPRTLLELRLAIKRADVVVGHGSTTLPMCAIASLGMSTPFVYRQISQQLFWANTPTRRLWTRLALRRADAVVSPWNGARDVLIRTFGVPPDRVHIVPNGVPLERCPPTGAAEQQAARDRFGLDHDRPVLLSIGAFVPEKGVDTLIRSMAEPPLAGWQLLLVGAGPELGTLRQLAASLDSATIVFHEPVARASDAIAAADVIGLASRGGDSMPAVLIEAGSMGVPVVATAIEGIVDIVLDGRTGRLVPIDDPAATADAIAEVVNERERFGRCAQRHCQANFAIERVGEMWQQVLERATDELPGTTQRSDGRSR